MIRSHEMLRVAGRALHLLPDAGREDVVAYVRGQQQPDGGFRGRAAGSDLYYTVFGGSCLMALHRPPLAGPVRRYLEALGDGANLDFVHQASLARCWAALAVPLLPSRRARALLPLLERHRADDGGYAPAAAGSAHGTIYGGFLAFLAYDEARVPLPQPDTLLASVRSLRTPDGGYANAPGVAGATTPATAAAVLLQQWIAAAADPAACAALQACACDTGGYKASPIAPAPDLLSTGTALFALHVAGVAPVAAATAGHLDFVESLWHASGGFCGHAADWLPDCEYTFYALLAMGACSSGDAA
jgi:hypothetical protein